MNSTDLIKIITEFIEINLKLRSLCRCHLSFIENFLIFSLILKLLSFYYKSLPFIQKLKFSDFNWLIKQTAVFSLTL